MRVSITTDNQVYNLASGQTVTSSGSFDLVRNAIRVDAQNVTLGIAGTVSGGTADAGILLDTGPRVANPDPYAGAVVRPYFYDRSSMAVTVAAGGLVSGYYGIYARLHLFNIGDPDQFGTVSQGGSALASVDNSGSILADGGGYALYSGLIAPAEQYQLPRAGFESVINRAGGTIGAIQARVDTLNNAGTIDGGSRAAISLLGGSVIENSGNIIGGIVADMRLGAVTSSSLLRISNTATGVISGGSAPINAGFGGLELTNAGTINGNLSVPTRYGGSVGNFIDNSRGTINGNVSFFGSDDLFVGRLGPGGVSTGVTGSLSGGDGTDTFALLVTGNVSTAMPVLPTGFERLRFELNDAASLTITSGTSAGIILSGRGSFTNAATITGNTTALSFGARVANAIETGPPIALKNTGVLSSSFAPGSDGNAVAAVFFKSSDLVDISPVLSRFENSGSITAENARAVIVSIGGRPDALFENTGTITSTTARAIEVAMVGTELNQFSNSGTIKGGTLIDFRSATPDTVSTGVNYGLMEAVGEVLAVSGGSFINYGTAFGGGIVSTGTGNAVAVRYTGSGIRTVFQNSADITSTGVGVAITDGQLSNTDNIVSSQKEAVIILGGGSIFNGAAGVLRGGNGVAVTRDPYYFSEDPVSIHNQGLIDGDLVLSSNVWSSWSDVTNSGVINGSVQFGVGNDIYRADTSGTQRDVRGGFGDDRLLGGSGNDLFYGEQGNDSLDGGAGNDLLIGGIGDDIYTVDGQGDVIIELAGEGEDLVSSFGSFYLYANLEALTLNGEGDYFGVGNELDNVIIGYDGSNLLLGGGGDDVLGGNAGSDSLFGEAGSDWLYGGDGVDYLVGGAGNDELSGDDDADALYGEDGNDLLVGGIGFYTDILVGGNGNDTLDGESGLGDYDLMDGGAGDDIYNVDTPDDLTFEAAGGGNDTVYANIIGAGYYLYAEVENLILLGNTPFGVGNELANQLTGNDIGNYLLGGLGNDTLNGWAGNDVLFGEGGADTFVFERGTGGDVIGDFQGGVDKIRLEGLGFADYAALQPNIFQVGGNTGINLGQGDFIVLNGVTNAQLSATDFIFG
jgi:Ca2+-binding RTX toxin-like protein